MASMRARAASCSPHRWKPVAGAAKTGSGRCLRRSLSPFGRALAPQGLPGCVVVPPPCTVRPLRCGTLGSAENKERGSGSPHRSWRATVRPDTPHRDRRVATLPVSQRPLRPTVPAPHARCERERRSTADSSVRGLRGHRESTPAPLFLSFFLEKAKKEKAWQKERNEKRLSQRNTNQKQRPQHGSSGRQGTFRSLHSLHSPFHSVPLVTLAPLHSTPPLTPYALGRA